MALKSALEDLLDTTIAGVAGIAGKIEYVAGLRDSVSGTYSHWGLTPLGALCEDAIVSSQGLPITAGEYVEGLRSRAPELLPADLGGGSARHFSSVLQALSILVSNPAEVPPEAIPPA